MNIFKRLKNLWKLSEWEPSFNYEEKNLKHSKDKISTLIKKQATIVDLSDDVDLE